MLWTAPATGIEVPNWGLLLRNHQRGSRAMNEVTTIGLDLAKNVSVALMRRVERLFAGS
jgi:hypothetical protein